MDGYLFSSLMVKVCQYVSVIFKRRSLDFFFHLGFAIIPRIIFICKPFFLDNAVLMAGVGDAFLHVSIKLDILTKECVCGMSPKVCL